MVSLVKQIIHKMNVEFHFLKNTDMKTRLHTIILSIILISSACQQEEIIQPITTQKQTTSQNSQIKLKWLAQWYDQGKREDFIREAAREFEFLNQEYEIELIFPHEVVNLDPGESNSGKIADSIANMVRRDEWPFDLMLCDGNLHKLVGIRLNDPDWGLDYLTDFKNDPWFRNSHKPNFLDSEQNFAAFSGIAPGAFIEGIYEMLYVSSDVENKLGLKIKPFDMTFNDYKAYAKAVYEYNQVNSDKITFNVFVWDYATKFFSHLVMTELQKEKPANTEESLIALKTVYDEFEKLAAYKPLEEHTTISNARDLSHTNVLFYYHASWINDIWKKRFPNAEKFMKPCELPSMEGKKAANYAGTYNCVFVVPKHAKNTTAATKLMKHISNNRSAETWTKYSKSPTGLQVQFSDSDFSSDIYANFSKHIKNKYQDKLISVNLSNQLFETNRRLNYHVNSILRGQMTADDAIASLKSQLNIE